MGRNTLFLLFACRSARACRLSETITMGNKPESSIFYNVEPVRAV